MPTSQTGAHTPVTSNLRMEFLPSSKWPKVAPMWRELAQRSPQCSFFLSEAWVATWIEVFAPVLDVSIVSFTARERPVGACLLVKTRSGRGMVRSRRISVNAAGEPAAETTYVEYNNLLCSRGWESAVASRLAAFLIDKYWDEVALDGFTPGEPYETLKLAFGGLELEEIWHPCYYIDLAELRRNAETFEMSLGSTTRKHLRQTLRSYSKVGPLRLEAAGDTAAALAMFDELAELNKRRWKDRSNCVVFAAPRFVAFHHALIARCFPQRTIELLRLSAGRRTIGIVYNFVHGGSVYFYQSGLDYSIDERLSPGIATLSYAVQRSIDRGMNGFDFLSGEAPYKRRMATSQRQLVWAVFRRPGLKTDIIKLTRVSTRWLRARTNEHSAQKVKT